jgi:putative endonuclease
MKQTYETGLFGEDTAAAYLCEKGMVLLAHRYRAKPGEIDLIMKDGDTVVFV